MEIQNTSDQYINKHLKARERGYIWLERELKWGIFVSTAVIAVFFVILFFALKPDLTVWVAALAVALALNAVWEYLKYRREYRNYQSIYRYLEEFEMGNYTYRGGEDFIGVGIRVQLAEQLARMGEAFGRLKSRLVEEKENTKGLGFPNQSTRIYSRDSTGGSFSGRTVRRRRGRALPCEKDSGGAGRKCPGESVTWRRSCHADDATERVRSFLCLEDLTGRTAAVW